MSEAPRSESNDQDPFIFEERKKERKKEKKKKKLKLDER